MGTTIIKSEKVTGPIKGGFLEKFAAKGQTKPAQEVIEPDPLSKLSTAVENIPDQSTAHTRVTSLMQEHALNYFELGGVLTVIKDKEWFGKHPSFGEYCLNELGFRQGKGYYLINIYKTLIELCVTWSAVEEAGWSKVALLCSKFPADTIDKEAFLERLNAAKSTPYKQLAEQFKGHAATDGVAATEAAPMIFKLYPDQRAAVEEALEKAGTEVDTEYDSVALEQVCLSYLSGPKAKKGSAKAVSHDQNLVEQFQKLGITAALDLVEKADPEADTEAMVVEYLEETGEEDVQRLFNLAFPEDPDPASLVKAG